MTLFTNEITNEPNSNQPSSINPNYSILGNTVGQQGTAQSSNVNLMFVDSEVKDIGSLISNLADNTIAIALESNTDGIAQIKRVLDDYKDVDSIHLVSHGRAGEFKLGSTIYNSSNIANYKGDLEDWQDSLSEEADVLFYGCNIAENSSGTALLEQFSQFTQADVAASDDLTGSSVKGGDWDLEYQFGDIESGIGFKDSIRQSYNSILPEKNLVREDFESSRGDYRIQTKTSYGINRVNNPKGSGTALRAELRYGDPVQSSGARAEISYDKYANGRNRIVDKMGTVYTYKFRTFNDRNSNSESSIIAQWHKREGTPPFAIVEKTDGTYEIRMDEYSRNRRVRRPLGISVKRGEWTDWTAQMKWSNKSDGTFKLFHNGKKVFEYNGANTTRSETGYFKLGIYAPGWSDDFKRGAKPDGRKIVRYYDNVSIFEGISGPTRPTNSGSVQTQETPPQPTNNNPVQIQEIPANEPKQTSNSATSSKPSPAVKSTSNSVINVEAEDLQLRNYRQEKNSLASGGKVVSLRGRRNNEEGRAVYVHKGRAGRYDMDLKYFDESDGTGRISVLVNNKRVDRWSLNQNSGTSGISAKNLQNRAIRGLSLKNGDRVTFVGKEQGGEHARIDSFSLTSISDRNERPVQKQELPGTNNKERTTRIQAEQLRLKNYRIEESSIASGGKVLSLRGNGGNEEGRATYVHRGRAGRYDINLNYFDENDGTGQIRVLVNNKQVDRWSLNQNSGETGLSERNRKNRVIRGLSLKDGDTVEIIGKENGKEHIRIDYLDLILK